MATRDIRPSCTTYTMPVLSRRRHIRPWKERAREVSSPGSYQPGDAQQTPPKQTCKPSSVSRDTRDGDHLSSPDVAIGIQRPTRRQAGHLKSSYSVLLQMGFAQPAGHPAAGELLPHHFTLAPIGSRRYVSVALSVGSPLLGITQHLARWSSDFPPRYLYRGGHPVCLGCSQLTIRARKTQFGGGRKLVILSPSLKDEESGTIGSSPWDSSPRFHRACHAALYTLAMDGSRT